MATIDKIIPSFEKIPYLLGYLVLNELGVISTVS